TQWRFTKRVGGMSQRSSSAGNNRPLVQVSPDYLIFQLGFGTQPGCVLKLSNLSSEKVAYKVKTTEPKRYLVRPNQGVIGPGGTGHIDVYLVERECNELTRTAVAATVVSGEDGVGLRAGHGAPGGIKKSSDKFLVMTVALEDETFSLIRALGAKEQADELTRLWAGVSRAEVRNKKLAVVLVPPLPGGTSGAGASPSPRAALGKSEAGEGGGPVTGGGASGGPAGTAWEDEARGGAAA
ncbi:unnamed protein product, partial [Discosporangium mesarthrocarpum]